MESPSIESDWISVQDLERVKEKKNKDRKERIPMFRLSARTKIQI